MHSTIRFDALGFEINIRDLCVYAVPLRIGSKPKWLLCT